MILLIIPQPVTESGTQVAVNFVTRGVDLDGREFKAPEGFRLVNLNGMWFYQSNLVPEGGPEVA